MLQYQSCLLLYFDKTMYYFSAGDVTVSNILKGLQEPNSVVSALSCLSTLIEVYTVSQGHAKIILSELIKLLTESAGAVECQLQTVGL